MTNYDRLSDQTLIAACRSGESKAWDALIVRYERLVYTIPTRYGLTPSEVDDVYQSVWLSLLRNLSSIREPDRIGAWLVTTARRECWERRRGAAFEKSFSTRPESIATELEDEAQSPEDVVASFRRHEALQSAVSELDETCQNLLWELYYDASAPSYAKIAEKLKMPIGSIGPKRARCIKKLREILENKQNEDINVSE